MSTTTSPDDGARIQPKAQLALLSGPSDQALLTCTLGELLSLQAAKHSEQLAVVSWTGVTLTYQQLYQRSRLLASSLLSHRIVAGDHVGIYAENCEIYIALLFAIAMVGGVSVVLNANYTPIELSTALRAADCKLLFTSTHIGSGTIAPSLSHLADLLEQEKSSGLQLQHIVLLRPKTQRWDHAKFFSSFESFVSSANSSKTQGRDPAFDLTVHDACNIQFTSGTTGSPKASMLTHYNIINNAQLIGDRMVLTDKDIICSPPPLFHCFGIVLGMLACITHGSTFVVPCPTFRASLVVDHLINYSCTGLLGVPTMLIAVLEEHEKRGSPPLVLRTGIAAGASVPRAVVEKIQSRFGFRDFINVYGMTETAPASFATSISDTLEKKLTTVGTILPHTSAKVVDQQGKVMERGQRGELCTAGYLLQKGYYKNDAKTAEVMRDEGGVTWMYTGDEAMIDDNGYCHITGRIKDLIIRGGENIFPLEIEERLMLRPEISLVSVVGLADERYGEVVAAFVIPEDESTQPNKSDLQEFVRQALGRHKTPSHIFWVGPNGVLDSLPMTASGKIQKNKLREWGNARVKLSLAKL